MSELGPAVLDIFPRGFLVVAVVVSEVIPSAPSETRVVVSKVFPRAPLETRVAVSELGPPLAGPCVIQEILVLLSPVQVSVSYPTPRPPVHPKYWGCFGNSSGRCGRHPNPIQWPKMVPNRRRLPLVPAGWTPLPVDY